MKRTAIALGTACMLVLLGCGGAIASRRASASSSEISARYTRLQDLKASDLNAMAGQYGATGSSHLQDLTAMGNEYRAHLSRLTATPPGFSHLQDLTAMANGAWRLPIVGSISVRTPASTDSSGFDWADAGIGAMSGFALALVLTAGPLVLLRGTQRHHRDAPKT